MIIFTPNTVIKSSDVNLNFEDVVKRVYPIGSIYITIISTNPNSVFGFGTWVAFGTGRTLVGIDAGQTEFDTVEETGGAKTVGHTHTTDAQGYHGHNINTGGITSGGLSEKILNTASNTPPGHYHGMDGQGSHAHNVYNTDISNLQPYIVTYMWKRTA